MGATLSSRKDFNRVLAQQPRTSIHIPRYDSLQPIRSENSTGSLPMPFPELTSKPQIQREHESASFSDAISVVSDHTAQSDSSYIIFDQMQQKQVNEFQPDAPMYDKIRSNDTVILSRSLMHEKDQQQMKNYCSTSIRPEHTMVERNGKKFIVKVKHRTERRYVEYNDPNTHKKRLFEVIDCIPYRIIEPYNEHSKSNNRSLQSTVRSSHSPIILALAENRSETSSPSTSDHSEYSSFFRRDTCF
ncbi:hypothetical protein I4U23_028222 [Adineta vaga]|nr:hypothetical protein I4U23_028222 [Adineta vaga]